MGKSTKTPVSLRMTADELDLLDRVAERFDGNKTKALVEGLKAVLQPGKMTKEQLIAEITRRLK